MKRLIVLASAILLIGTFSCKRGIYHGFDRMDNGAYMVLHTPHTDSVVSTRHGDLVIFDLLQYTSDSVYFNSYVFDRPITVWLPESDFEGDVYAALLDLTTGDSATLVFPIDSLYEHGLLSDMPIGVEGQPFYSDIKVHEVIPHDLAKASYDAFIQECKDKEQYILESFLKDGKVRRTESGLIILDINNNKGRKGSADNMVQFHAVMVDLTNNGDTLVNSYAQEPFFVQWGSQFIGGGFDEALYMLGKGAKGSFVIPSSLRGADSAFIEEPYSVVKADIEILDIFTQEEYKGYVESVQKAKQKLMQQRIVEEAIKVDEYLRVNKIDAEPTENGVYYIETSKGSGDEVRIGDRVRVHYVLYNLDGVQVESSYEYGEPIEFVYGREGMLPGLEEALGLMRVGGTARAIVPPMMGFGDQEFSEELPAFSTLVFDLFLAAVTRD